MQQVAFLTLATTGIPTFCLLPKKEKADIPIKVYLLLLLDKVFAYYHFNFYSCSKILFINFSS